MHWRSRAFPTAGANTVRIMVATIVILNVGVTAVRTLVRRVAPQSQLLK